MGVRAYLGRPALPRETHRTAAQRAARVGMCEQLVHLRASHPVPAWGEGGEGWLQETQGGGKG